jgi:tetratricopeptide (TPR) repeat protein
MKYSFKLSSILLSLLICFSITKSHAQSSSEFHKLADEKDQKGKFRAAVKLYQKALDLEPINVEILEKMVYAKSNTGQYGSAIDNLNTLINLKPQSSKFHFIRGFFQFNLKNYTAAIVDYSRAIQLQEDKISDFNIYSERGLCKLKLKDYSGAIQDFDKSLAIYRDPGITKHKKEAEIKLKENPPTPKYRVVETKVHHIVLKKPVLTTN